MKRAHEVREWDALSHEFTKHCAQPDQPSVRAVCNLDKSNLDKGNLDADNVDAGNLDADNLDA